jgi:hypothetical protein
MIVEADKASDARTNRDKSAYDLAATLWSVGLVSSLAGAAAVVSGGILFGVRGHGEAPRSQGSIWLGVGAGDVRVGGTW